MFRRSFVTLAALAAVAGVPAPAVAQQTVTLKFHTFMTPPSAVWRTMHTAWMDKVEKDSGGRIKFERYPAMQLGGTPANPDSSQLWQMLGGAAARAAAGAFLR